MLGLLIMKHELDDNSNVMIMIEKIRKFSVFYVNFPNNFKIIFQMFHAAVLIICDLF